METKRFPFTYLLEKEKPFIIINKEKERRNADCGY